MKRTCVTGGILAYSVCNSGTVGFVGGFGGAGGDGYQTNIGTWSLSIGKAVRFSESIGGGGGGGMLSG